MQVGQLLAVNAEEDAWLRAQVISMEEGKIKASIMKTNIVFQIKILLLIWYPLTVFSFLQKLEKIIYVRNNNNYPCQLLSQ